MVSRRIGLAAGRPSIRPDHASRSVVARSPGSWSAEYAREDIDVLRQVPRPEEVITHARLRRGAHALGAVGIRQQLADAPAKRGQVGRRHETAADPALDLVLDATDGGCDHRPA